MSNVTSINKNAYKCAIEEHPDMCKFLQDAWADVAYTNPIYMKIALDMLYTHCVHNEMHDVNEELRALRDVLAHVWPNDKVIEFVEMMAKEGKAKALQSSDDVEEIRKAMEDKDNVIAFPAPTTVQ